MPHTEQQIVQRARHFARDDSGAVTVDWVVLTASLVGLTILLSTILTESLYENAGLRIAQDMETAAQR